MYNMQPSRNVKHSTTHFQQKGAMYSHIRIEELQSRFPEQIKIPPWGVVKNGLYIMRRTGLPWREWGQSLLLLLHPHPHPAHSIPIQSALYPLHHIHFPPQGGLKGLPWCFVSNYIINFDCSRDLSFRSRSHGSCANFSALWASIRRV